MDFDAIVIGSGFGGAITACRLAEANLRVLILERGRRWDKTNYPREAGDMWVWNQDQPEREHGWIDLRMFPHMSVVQGAAVGGGSLIYANISCEAPASAFQTGWPREIDYAELKPYYDKVAKFMNVQQVPANQWTKRMQLMKEAAGKTDNSARFKQLDVAVSFDPTWSYDKPDCFNPANSRRFLNAQGVEQGTCVHLGNCDIGCDVDAKNTLDRNYIPWAEKHGAEVRPLHLVTDIQPVDGGYKVSFDSLESGVRAPGSQTARIVILAAGSLGSTELLLRCRDLNKTLPQVSPFLGTNWSSNGDFLTPAFYEGRRVDASRGPTIACAIDFLDRSVNGQSFWIEDGGFPNLLFDYITRLGQDARNLAAKAIIDAFRDVLGGVEPFSNVMPWFAQGADAANGTLSMQRSWFTGNHSLSLAWDIDKSKELMDTIVDMHLKFSEATGGRAIVPPTWTLGHALITPHPLGGCGMGDSAATGVVDHTGKVFNYDNLYVVDGSIVPEALGVNPSRTIGALAERAAALLCAKEARPGA